MPDPDKPSSTSISLPYEFAEFGTTALESGVSGVSGISCEVSGVSGVSGVSVSEFGVSDDESGVSVDESGVSIDERPFNEPGRCCAGKTNAKQALLPKSKIPASRYQPCILIVIRRAGSIRWR